MFTTMNRFTNASHRISFFWKAKVFPFDSNHSSCTLFPTLSIDIPYVQIFCSAFLWCLTWELFWTTAKTQKKKHRKSPQIIFVRNVVRRKKKLGPMTVTQQHKYRLKWYSRKLLWSYLLFLEWDRSKTYNNNPLSIDWRTDDTMWNERY